MRKNFGNKPHLYPQPVFIVGTYNEDGTPNAMVAAWGGISYDFELSLCISAGHKTAANVKERRAFTVSMATADLVAQCDYLGLVSGRKEPDKVARAGLHPEKSAFVDAPIFAELPMAVECKLLSYDPETCRLVGEIVNVSVDESVLNEEGKADPAKLRPITFDSMNDQYLVLGEVVGKAYSAGMKFRG